MAEKKSKQVAEFGDFQTPDDLAAEVLGIVQTLGLSPASIIEPSCGRGAFLYAAACTFPQARLIGVDINPGYLLTARERLHNHQDLELKHASFFVHDWTSSLKEMPAPILILGNPPWVTNAELGTLGSDNLPIKSNHQNLKGLDALTGKSNFDISEWMLLENIEWLRIKGGGSLAVLCKTAVARKILTAVWKRNIPIEDARIYRIDALANFGAAVDACLFVLKTNGHTARHECAVFPSLSSGVPESNMGFLDGTLVANTDLYGKHKSIRGVNKSYTWRSGLKHDCAKVMELDRTPEGLRNGLGELVDIEETYLYPLIKSSDIAGSRQKTREKLVIVTQRAIGAETSSIERHAPRTWAYLQRNSVALSRRTSVIYSNKPEFSIFGVGNYSFTAWKIAISGLYKKLSFRLYGSDTGKPIIFDDTVYFLPFETREEAQSILEMLQSVPAQEFLHSMVFWDEKRPITVELLKRIDLNKLAVLLGRSHDLAPYRTIEPRDPTENLQHRLFA
jgi:SAM-dependent methyltransferase